MATYICSDLHGNYNVWHEIKKFLKKDDKLICLGDVIDRGSAGYSILVEMLGDPRVELIMGNHEDMMVAACDSFIKYQVDNTHEITLWTHHNGGNYTFEDWQLDPGRMEVLEQVRNLPLSKEFKNEMGLNLILTHAGCNAEQFHYNVLEKEDLLWDRYHYHLKWDGKEEDIVIHGHTPMVKMLGWPDFVPVKAFWYSNNHKVCLDCLTAFTNFTILLNADTFEEHIIGEPIEEVLW